MRLLIMFAACEFKREKACICMCCVLTCVAHKLEYWQWKGWGWLQQNQELNCCLHTSKLYWSTAGWMGRKYIAEGREMRNIHIGAPSWTFHQMKMKRYILKCHNLYQWHTANKKIELLPLSLKLYSTTVCSLNVKEYSVRKQNSGIQPTTKKNCCLKIELQSECEWENRTAPLWFFRWGWRGTIFWVTQFFKWLHNLLKCELHPPKTPAVAERSEQQHQYHWKKAPL